MVDGGLDNGVVGVEVAVGEVVSHAGEVTPGDGGFLGQQLGLDVFDGFPDFDESESDGVEDETVGQGAACEVGPDDRMTAAAESTSSSRWASVLTVGSLRRGLGRPRCF